MRNGSHPPSPPTPCGGDSTSTFDNLYPAIVQCFVIILLGYITGRMGKITVSQGKGLGTFISTFALPALLFKSMVELDFSVVNWRFLASIFVAKLIVFCVVLICGLATTRPVNFGKAGLYSIFTTQSNDFAIGYPILLAIYQKCHPDYIKYIYLLAPISLVILNPIGFVMLEIEQRRQLPPSERTGCGRAMLGVIVGVIKNPIVFMTAVGIAGNFVFQQQVPDVLRDVLLVLGNSFSATALFYLGLSMVGKIKSQGGINLITPVLLITAKTLLLPFIAREMVNVFEAGRSDNSTSELAEYGFLYGTFPSTPSVFLFATQYSTATDTIATSMVAGTFLSAPLMFVSAQMVTMPITDTSMYSVLITATSFNISILGLFGCVWVLTLFLVTRRIRFIPHQFTVSLIGAHAMSCVGMILWCKANDVQRDGFLQYLQYILFFTGTLSARCWVAVLSVVLCLLRCRSLCCVLRWRVWFFIYGFGFPTFLTGLLLIITSRNKPHDFGDPAFQYGIPQLVMAVVVLALNIVVTIVTLILQTRYDRQSRLNKYGEKLDRSSSTEQLLSNHNEDGSGDHLHSKQEEKCTNQTADTCGDCTDCSSKTGFCLFLFHLSGSGNNLPRFLCSAACP